MSRNPAIPETSGPSGADQPGTHPKSRVQSLLAKLFRSREFSVVIVLFVLCMAMAFSSTSSQFFSQRNINNILFYMAILSIFAIGETLVIITAGIDLSLGSMIGFIGMVTALCVTSFGVGLASWAAILLGIICALLAALAIGCLHGTFVHKLQLPPFVVTLASLLILRSQSLVINKQLPIAITDYPALLFLAQGNIPIGSYHIPMPVVILAVIAVSASLVLNKTRIGRYLYSIGSNEQATRLSGVNVYKVKLFAYGASALLGGIAGVLIAANGNQGDPQAGSGYELNAVAAAVVGGANLMGGEGSVMGTVLGATLLQVILSIINLRLASPDIWRDTVVGGILLFAVLVTALQQRRSA